MSRPADELRQLLDERPGRLVVGITGPPGAGKSTLARTLVDELTNADGAANAAYVPMDGFHLSNAQLARLGRHARKGAPDTFDVDGYAATLRRVKQDYGIRDVYVPDFDRAIDEPVAAGLVVPSEARLVITEGNYLALWPEVRGLVDRLYYLDVSTETRRRRLVDRHVAGGRPEATAKAWVTDVDEANAALISATRAACDAVL